MNRVDGLSKQVPGAGGAGIDKAVPGLAKSLTGHGVTGDMAFKVGYVEKIGPDGFVVEPSDPAGRYLNEVLNRARTQGSLLMVTSDDLAMEQTTRLLLMPMSAMPAVGMKEKMSGARGSGTINAERGDVAVCWTYRVKDAGEGKLVCGVAIMGLEDARSFYEEVAEDPMRVFEMADAVNKGPVLGRDQNPVEVFPGKALVVLPNDMFGGKLKDKYVSAPFSVNSSASGGK